MNIVSPMRSPEAAGLLRQMCRILLKPHFVMAELGCYHGVSTRVFSQHVKTIYAVDPWAQEYVNSEDWSAVKSVPDSLMSRVEAIFDAGVKDLPNVVKKKGRHEEVVLGFEDESLDLVYCDALHSEVETLNAIDLWTPKVKPGGWVTGHDYFKKPFPGVVAAVQKRRSDEWRVFPGGNWVYRKPDVPA